MREHRFRPTVMARLEERLTPSHSGLSAHVSALVHPSASSLLLSGKAVVNTSMMSDVSQTASLTGNSKVSALGQVRSMATLYTNPAGAIGTGSTSGSLNLRVLGKTPGTATLVLDGPFVTLAGKTSTTNLGYRVTNATGSLASMAETQGNAVLTLHAKTPPTSMKMKMSMSMKMKSDASFQLQINR